MAGRVGVGDDVGDGLAREEAPYSQQSTPHSDWLTSGRLTSNTSIIWLYQGYNHRYGHENTTVSSNERRTLVKDRLVDFM
jgi:hypothetical protein